MKFHLQAWIFRRAMEVEAVNVSVELDLKDSDFIGWNHTAAVVANNLSTDKHGSSFPRGQSFWL